MTSLIYISYHIKDMVCPLNQAALLLHVAVSTLFYCAVHICIFIYFKVDIRGFTSIFQNMCCKKSQKLALWNLLLSNRRVGQWLLGVVTLLALQRQDQGKLLLTFYPPLSMWMLSLFLVRICCTDVFFLNHILETSWKKPLTNICLLLLKLLVMVQSSWC